MKFLSGRLDVLQPTDMHAFDDQLFSDMRCYPAKQNASVTQSLIVLPDVCADPIEEEDAHLLLDSVREVLKAAAMAEADVLSETWRLLIGSAKDFSRRLWGLVPGGLYLPAPPLYCPQPAVLSEVS